MSWRDDYLTRMATSNANNTSDYFSKSTKESNSRVFRDSTTYKLIKVDGIEMDTRVIQGKDDEHVDILFLPDTEINKGSIVEISTGVFWLIINVIGNEVYPKVKAKLCNSTFTLKGETTQTIIGYDSLGRPVPEIVEGEDVEVPCIAEHRVMTGDNNQPINLPDGRLLVTLPYTEHDDVQIGQNFHMYETKYQIVGVDKTKSINGVGLIILTGERRD